MYHVLSSASGTPAYIRKAPPNDSDFPNVCLGDVTYTMVLAYLTYLKRTSPEFQSALDSYRPRSWDIFNYTWMPNTNPMTIDSSLFPGWFILYTLGHKYHDQLCAIIDFVFF